MNPNAVSFKPAHEGLKQSFEIRLTENLDWDLWLSLENSNKVIQNFIPEI